MRRTLLGATAIAFSIAFAADASAETHSIFPGAAGAKAVFAEGRFTEAVDVADDGSVYFADVAFPGLDRGLPGQTLRYDPGTGQTSVFIADNGNTDGLKIRPGERIVTAQSNFRGTDDIVETSLKTHTRRVLAAAYQGRPFNGPNDLAFDRSGRAYVTDVHYAGPGPAQPTNGVYRIDPDGRVTRLISDLAAPNGGALSPDGATLYVADSPFSAKGGPTPPWSIRAYDLSADGQVSRPRIFVQFAAGEQGADGMATDVRGDLFIAYRGTEGRHGLRVFSHSGADVDFLQLPDRPSNLAFARGAEASILYVTGGKTLYRVKTTTQGWRP